MSTCIALVPQGAPGCFTEEGEKENEQYREKHSTHTSRQNERL